MIPLTRQPERHAGMEDRHPVSKVTPEPRDPRRATSGSTCCRAGCGSVLGDHDLVLGPGEVAEFDTQVPHWFGSTGEEPAEILSIFGRPGERMKVRTPPSM